MVTESKAVQLPRALTVKELADLIGVSAVEIIKELMKNGLMASINQVIDYDTADIHNHGGVAEYFHWSH